MCIGAQVGGKMSILNYLHRVKKSSCDQLLDPSGQFNTEGKVPSSAIASANIAIQAVLAGKSEATINSSSVPNLEGLIYI